jgi:hypothetical protein
LALTITQAVRSLFAFSRVNECNGDLTPTVGYNLVHMRHSDLIDRLTFSKATVAVAALTVCMNVLWYLLGKPAQRAAHGASWAGSPQFLVCDLIAVGAAIALILKYRTWHYRLLVIVYAMLLANALAVLAILIFHRY